MTGFFCPKCKGKELSCIYAEPPEYGECDEVWTREFYRCDACEHSFEISAGYALRSFNFVEDPYMGDEDIEVGEGGE